MAIKLLHIDIETAPHKVFSWGLFEQNIGINQIVEPGYTMCFAAQWHGKRGIIFDSIWKSGHEAMVDHVHSLLGEADAVTHHNGRKFDIPMLNMEFCVRELPPPAPYQQIDFLRTCRRQFKFASNKLDYVTQALGLGGKLEHKGMDLWRDCMDGCPKSQRLMERYNKQDVRLLGPLYEHLKPWLVDHPNAALYSDSERPTCRVCGSDNLQSRGTEKTSTHAYRRFQCNDCGSWSRSRTNCTPNKEAVLAKAG